MRTTSCVVALVLTLVGAAAPAAAFSVLAHQGVVDACWEDTIAPALRRRFPGLSADALERAHAFAYGGSHVADLGYFPFGSREFTDLVHYVRSGDFVTALVEDAATPDEVAFALGAVGHWVTDTTGHPEATNRAVAQIYPDLRARFGEWITYDEDHGSHLQTEFRFDVLQLSLSRQTPDLFRHAVAFEVAEPLLDRAFRETYGLGLADLFVSTPVAITTYRWGFRNLVEEATGIAWQLYRADITQLDPSATADEFVFGMSHAEFVQQFGTAFREAGSFARLLGVFTKLVPRVGPLERLPYKALPPEVRTEYRTAFRRAVARLREEVGRPPTGRDPLPNLNLDTGAPTRGGTYEPADAAYAALLVRLEARGLTGVPPGLRSDVLRFYRERAVSAAPAPDDDDARHVAVALERLAGPSGTR